MIVFYENQVFFFVYVFVYVFVWGEQYYCVSDFLYQIKNGVILGLVCMKFFKNGGFDYVYVVGNILWYIYLKVLVFFGN